MARFKKVPLEQLMVDKTYQRPLDDARVKRMAKDFRPAMVGVLEVSRHNGKCVVFDGQHRLAAAKRVGLDALPCMVHENLSQAQEAELFWHLQRDRKPIHPVQAFRARRVAGDPVACDIAEILKTHNRAVGSVSRKSDRDIAAVATLERIYRRGNLDRTLELLSLWDGDAGQVEASFMDGVSLLEQRYGERLGEHEHERLAAVSAVVVVRNAMSHIARQQRRGFGNPDMKARAEEVFCELRRIAGLRGAARRRAGAAA